MADRTVQARGKAPADCRRCQGNATTFCIIERFAESDCGHYACLTCGITFDSNVNEMLDVRLGEKDIRNLSDETEYRRLFVETSHIGQADGSVYTDFDWADNAAVKQGVAKHILAAMARHRTGARPPRLLDLGCGNGFTAIELARQLPGAQILAVDPSPDVLRADGQSGIRALQGTIDSLRLPAKSFDVVVIIGNLMLHLDPRNTLREVDKVLADGGLLILDFKNIDATLRRGFMALARLRLLSLIPRSIRERAFLNMRWGFNRGYMREMCTTLGLVELECYSKPPRLLEFANRSQHQRGLKGLIWRATDRLDAWRDEQAWVQMAWRKAGGRGDDAGRTGRTVPR